MNYTPALHWTTNEPTQGSETDQGQKGAMAGSYENMGACDTHRIKCKWQGTKLRVYTKVIGWKKWKETRLKIPNDKKPCPSV